MHNSILIKGGRVISGSGSPPFFADVLIKNHMITEVAQPGTLSTQDALNIDASGKTVMPGLIDAHCHISFDEPSSNDELFFHRRHGLSAIIAAANAQAVLRAGVTSFLDADSIFEIGVDLRDAIEAGVIVAPRMATGGYAIVSSIGGTAGRLFPSKGTIGYARIVNGRKEIVAEVRRQIKAGVDWIKVMVTGLVPRRPGAGEVLAWSAKELKIICDTAHDLGVPVVGHCRNAKSISAATDAGFDMLLHATNMDDRTLEKVVARKIAICPTFTYQVNLIDYGNVVGANRELRAIFEREIESSASTLRRAFDAGVPLLCGSESGFSLVPYGEWHYKEMEIFVRYLGLTPLQAIRCATYEGAFALGLTGRTGEIAVGRHADLIIVDGDPSVELAVLGRRESIIEVIAGGRRVDLSSHLTRRSIPGWRVGDHGKKLTREIAAGGAARAAGSPSDPDDWDA